VEFNLFKASKFFPYMMSVIGLIVRETVFNHDFNDLF